MAQEFDLVFNTRIDTSSLRAFMDTAKQAYAELARLAPTLGPTSVQRQFTDTETRLGAAASGLPGGLGNIGASLPQLRALANEQADLLRRINPGTGPIKTLDSEAMGYRISALRNGGLDEGSSGGGGSGGLLSLLGLGGSGGLSGILGGATLGVGFRLAGEVRQAVSEAIALNQQLTVLSDQANAIGQGSGFKQLRSDIIETAQSTGVAAGEVASLASEFLGLYQNTTQAATATNDAAKILRVFGGDATTVGPQLGAIAEDLHVSVQDIGNSLVDLQDKTGRTGTDLLSALGQVAPVAATLNLNLDQTRGLIEAVGVGSAKSGQQIGDLLGRILPELQDKLPKLQQDGIQFGGAAKGGDMAAALRDILTQVNSTNQEQVTVDLGGPRGAQVFAAVIQNRQRALEELDGTLSNHNLLNERAKSSEDTLAGSLQKMHQELVSLGDAFIHSPAVGFFKDILDLGGGVLGLFDSLDSKLHGLPVTIAEAALAIKGLMILLGSGGGAAAAGEGGSIAGGSSGLLGGILGGAGVRGALSGPAGAIVIPATVVGVGAVQTAKDIRTHQEQVRDDLVKQFDAMTLDELQKSIGTRQAIKDPHPSFGQHITSALLGLGGGSEPTNLFSASQVNNLARTEYINRIGQAGSSTLAGYGVSPDLLSAASSGILSTKISQDTGGVLDQVSSLQEITQAFQDGQISIDQMNKAAKDYIASESGFTGNPKAQAQVAKDAAALAKINAQQVAQTLQQQVDDIVSGGGSPAEQLAQQIADTQNALKNPALQGDQTTLHATQNKLASLIHQQNKQTITDIQQSSSANLALRKALNGDDPTGNAQAAVDSLQSELDKLVASGADQATVTPVNAQLIEAQNELDKLLNAQAESAISLAEAQDKASGNTLKAAQDHIDLIKRKIADTNPGDVTTLNGLHGELAQANADQIKLLDDQAQSFFTLDEAKAKAAGDPVKAAQLHRDALQDQLNKLRQQGADETAINDMQAKVIDAQTALDQTTTSTLEKDLQTQYALHKITLQQYVAALRNREAQVTNQGDKDAIELEIQNLLNKGPGTFNIPSGITLPSLYEARRFQSTGNGGYVDNRNIKIDIAVSNGMDIAQLQAMLGDVIGGAPTMGTVTRVV